MRTRGRSTLPWRRAPGMTPPNMTPMADVVIVILVFFMSATALLGPELFLRASVAGDGPPATDPFELPPVTLEIRLAVDARGRVVASGSWFDAVQVAGLAAAVRADPAAPPPDDTTIALVPSPHVPYQAVVRAREACERAGYHRVTLVPPEG